jgi:hypothetical protein
LQLRLPLLPRPAPTKRVPILRAFCEGWVAKGGNVNPSQPRRCPCSCPLRPTPNRRHLDRSHSQSHREWRSGETPHFTFTAPQPRHRTGCPIFATVSSSLRWDIRDPREPLSSKPSNKAGAPSSAHSAKGRTYPFPTSFAVAVVFGWKRGASAPRKKAVTKRPPLCRRPECSPQGATTQYCPCLFSPNPSKIPCQAPPHLTQTNETRTPCRIIPLHPIQSIQRQRESPCKRRDFLLSPINYPE